MKPGASFAFFLPDFLASFHRTQTLWIAQCLPYHQMKAMTATTAVTPIIVSTVLALTPPIASPTRAIAAIHPLRSTVLTGSPHTYS